MKCITIRVLAAFLCMLLLATGAAAASPVQYAPGNHVRWIDRIAIPSTDYVTPFYSWLEANAGSGGALQDPTGAALFAGKYYAYKVASFSGSMTFSCDTSDSSAVSQAFNAAIREKHGIEVIYKTARAVYQAFQKDHPEVFWLSGTTSVTFVHNGSTYKRYSGYATGEYSVDVIFVLKNTATDFDVRDTLYRGTRELADSIALRDAAIAQILTDPAVTGAATRYDQVRALNNWLTTHNAYNSGTVSGKATSGVEAYNCLAALTGRTGSVGPVCESYSEAFKILCDRLGIPCVIVKGDAYNSTSATGEGHQWNYVQMDDGNWYGVDVTWNDPTVKNKTDAMSGSERESYLLVGSSTVIDGRTFTQSHLMDNRGNDDDFAFTNEPRLAVNAYDPTTAQPLSAQPRPNIVLGDVLYTDIRAYVDNRPIRSYNIGGSTYIVVEDLLDYGFNVQWNGEERTLVIGMLRTAHPLRYTASYTHPAVTQPTGTVAMPYYYTDITTWIGSTQVTGYNIGGFTCICMDDLAAFFSTGYVWDGAARTLRLSTVA